MIHDRNTVGYFQSPGAHGDMIRQKYWAKGEDCPVVVCFGQDPMVFASSTLQLPWTEPELNFAGYIKGRPIEVIKDDVTGLPIPARAEIAIAGFAPPPEKESRKEGPFGEWTGYYAGSQKEEPVFKIKRIYHRNDPILTCAASQRPPHSHLFERSFIRSAGLWDKLEKTDCPGIEGVWVHEAGSGRTFNVIAIKQAYYGHARQAGLLASQVPPAGYVNRFTVVVDAEYIDPSNLYDVIWAMGTRCNPEGDIDILRKNWSSRLDPLVFGDELYNSRAVIDATIPYEHRKDFPKIAQTSPEYKKTMMDKYGALIKNIIG